MNTITRTFSLITLFIVTLTACQKEVSCQINGVAIDKSIIGVDRDTVLSKIGQPKNSAIATKGFDEFTFSAERKRYAVVLRYQLKNDKYYVLDQKCIKAKGRLELSNSVIWH